jgi:hypothetical protein
MTVQTPGEFISERGWLGWLYHLVFPLDLWLVPKDDEADYFREQKFTELLPIFGWLVPLAVILSNTVALGIFGMVFLFGIMAFLMAFASYFHLGLTPGRTIELALNLWAGFVITALAMWLVVFLFGLFTTLELDD